jgi:hypothetical protein
MPVTVISVVPTSLSLVAGNSGEAIVTLQNSGLTVDQFTVSIEGLDSRWYSLPVSSVALFPKDQDSLKIELHPPKSGIKGGSYPFRLKVVSQENPTVSTMVDLSLHIETLPEVGLEIVRVSGGRKPHYRVIANNPQTTTTVVEFKPVTSDKRLKFSLSPKTLKIPREDSVEAELDVSLDWLTLFFGKREAEFQVTANKTGSAEARTPVARVTVVRWYEVL